MNLSPNLVVYSCIADENQLTVTFVKEKTIDSRVQTVLGNQQIVCTGAEIEAFKKFLPLLEFFQLYHVFGRENAKTETNPFTYAQACSTSSLMSLNDKSLPAEIRQRIEKNNVQSIVFRDKTDRVNANYTITFINDNQNFSKLNFSHISFSGKTCVFPAGM